MSRIRTFVAIQATDEVRVAGERLIRKLARDIDKVRWVQPDNIHLSVKFLGDVEDREVYHVCSMVQQVAAARAAFQLPCCSLGAFPNSSRPRTIWMGVRDEEGELAELHKSVEDALRELGFPAESRQYHGHLTLGRVPAQRQGNSKLKDVIEEHGETEFGLLPVDELIVYASELTREGPNYTVLGRCPLA